MENENENENGVTFYGIIDYLFKSKKPILIVTIVCFVIAIIYNLFVVKNIYGRTVGVSLPAEVDDRNLYNIVLILEAKKGQDSFVGAKNITGSTIINLIYENTDVNKLQIDSDEYTKICIQKINDYLSNFEKTRLDKKNTEEIKQNLKLMVLGLGNDKELNAKLTEINAKLDEKEVIRKAMVFSDTKVSTQHIKPNKKNNVAAFTIFGFLVSCAFVIGKYYKEH